MESRGLPLPGSQATWMRAGVGPGRHRPLALGARSEAPPTPQQRTPGVAVDGVGGAVSILLPALLSGGADFARGWGGPGEREGHLVPEGATGMGVCQAKFCFILAPRAGGREGLPFPFSLPSGGGGVESSPPPLLRALALGHFRKWPRA